MERQLRDSLGNRFRPRALEQAFDFDWQGIRLRGKIDRIDENPEGDLLILDYKTGNIPPDSRGVDPLAAGRRIQLAVYALAAERLAPGAEVEAYYWYLKQPEVREGWDHTAFPLIVRRLETVMNNIFDGIERGRFPAVPGTPKWLFYSGADSWEHCEHCPFDRVCPRERDTDFERKHADAALDNYRNLEITPEDLEVLHAEVDQLR